MTIIMKQALLLTSLVLAANTAFAHAVLKQSVPARGMTVDASPPEMRLQFNEPLEASFMSVKLVGPAGDVATEKAVLDASDPSVVLMPLPKLASGTYEAQWSAMGHDGHRMKGKFSFTVK
jgi:copper resistance protein C